MNSLETRCKFSKDKAENPVIKLTIKESRHYLYYLYYEGEKSIKG